MPYYSTSPYHQGRRLPQSNPYHHTQAVYHNPQYALPNVYSPPPVVYRTTQGYHHPQPIAPQYTYTTIRPQPTTQVVYRRAPAVVIAPSHRYSTAPQYSKYF